MWNIQIFYDRRLTRAKSTRNPRKTNPRHPAPWQPFLQQRILKFFVFAEFFRVIIPIPGLDILQSYEWQECTVSVSQMDRFDTRPGWMGPMTVVVSEATPRDLSDDVSLLLSSAAKVQVTRAVY